MALPNPGADFPVDLINSIIAKTGLKVEFDDDVLDHVLNMRYAGQQTFLALSLLYDDAAWGTMQFHQDHLFAQSLFKPKELSSLGRLNWLEQRDRLGNICLLLGHENVGKQDMPMRDWLATRDSGFLRRHLIPEDTSLWSFEQFPNFLQARENLIRHRLRMLFVATP